MIKIIWIMSLLRTKNKGVNMKIIGITGKSGSGKSTLTEWLSKELNCQSVNVDTIGHQATSDEKIAQKLCEIFGREILGEDKKIDRKKLGNLVFSDAKKMDQLTEVTWGYMQKVLDTILEKQPEILILEWALLPMDEKYWKQCDIKVLMKADDNKRKTKVMERDNISEAYFLKRDANSMNYDQYQFDYVFENDYQIKTMEKIVTILK